VTLFDIDYVLAKTSVQSSSKEEEEECVFYAMIDECPHKKVALSEGRITDCGTSDKRYIQCSYHGMYCGVLCIMCRKQNYISYVLLSTIHGI